MGPFYFIVWGQSPTRGADVTGQEGRSRHQTLLILFCSPVCVCDFMKTPPVDTWAQTHGTGASAQSCEVEARLRLKPLKSGQPVVVKVSEAPQKKRK